MVSARAKQEKDAEEAKEAQLNMIRAYHDLVAIVTAFCDVNMAADQANKNLYKSHLNNIKVQVESDNPDYQKLSSEYYLLKASICGITNHKKMGVMTTAVNATNELKSERIEERKCVIL